MKYQSLPILSGVLAMMLTGCVAEEAVSDPTPDSPSAVSGIEICGGHPSGLPLSRASEPAVLGYCLADKIDFRIYRYHSSGISYSEPSSIGDLKPETTINGVVNSVITENITEYSGPYLQNKGLNWGYTAKIPNYVTAFYIPALAYTEADAPLFSCTTPADPSAMTLSLKTKEGVYVTPEVYFGRLSFITGDKSIDNDIHTSAKGFQWFNRGVAKDFNGEVPVSGKLYRIVSGLTAQITDVNPKIVSRMEMYLSNIPTEISLYGNHGAFYPVGAASGDAQHTKIASGDNDIEWIKIAESEDMGAGTVNLSTFLLPSVEGRSLMIRLYFAPGVIKDGDGDIDSGMSVHTRDYVIRAPKSVFLTGEDAEVYLDGAPDDLKGGGGVYLYDISANSFYSYSNVRINLKGSFDDFFTSTQNVDFKIEVCPSFDRVHNDIEIDY